jgi:hypothetical protein
VEVVVKPPHTVVELPSFVADARAAGLSDDERWAVVVAVACDPRAGDVIPGTGGARKVRFAGRGRGKSGGYMVITFYSGEDVPVFLLNVFAKGDRVDLTQAERNAMRKELAGLVEDYRTTIGGIRR